MVKSIKIDKMVNAYNAKNPGCTPMTRQGLAEAAGCSYSLVNNLQSGIVGKGTQILNRIAETLDCTIDDLIEK